jgi:hypothetical protein
VPRPPTPLYRIFKETLMPNNTRAQSLYINYELKTTKQYQLNERKSQNKDQYLLNNKPIAQEGG